VKTSLKQIVASVALGTLAVAFGCVEQRAVPVYQSPTAYPAQPVYQYQPQTAYPGQPPTVQIPTANGPVVTPQSPPGINPNPAAQPAPQPDAVVQPSTPAPVVVTQGPPPSMLVEAVPVAPGPEYYWTPGYWAWRGAWVWSPGVWVVRPRPGAIWIGPRWAHRGRNWVWVGGYWRF
jgi:hypothetical protein